MANVYVRSGAAGAGTGADWANAYTTLAAAFTAKAAGDVFYASEDHAETQGSAMTLTCPGTLANPCFVYCVNHAGTVPPVSADLRTTATITTTGNFGITINGSFYCYGVIFNCGSGAVSAAFAVASSGSPYQTYVSCQLNKLGTGAAVAITFGSTAPALVKLVNTPIQFGNTSDWIRYQCNFSWKGTAAPIGGAIFPTTVFGQASCSGTILFEGLDLSALAGKTLFGSAGVTGSINIKDCKLGAATVLAATPAVASDVFVTRSDSGATNNRCEKYSYTGTETTETTIVRSGGASDGAAQSRKIVTTANSKWVEPFEALPLVYWNTVVGVPTTVTIEGVWSGGAVPNNDDIWFQAEYPGSTLTPLGSFTSGTKADGLATGTALASSTETWASSPGTAFKMAVTFTPQMAGPVTLYVRAAKASTTFYVDPKVTVS